MARKPRNEEQTEQVENQYDESSNGAGSPTEQITIQGVEFTAPVLYFEGHVLTENEAGVLNQTLHENLRNNFAGRVKAAKEEAEKNGTEIDLGSLHSAFAEYAAGYQFGVRRPGSSPVSRDPVWNRAMVLARQIVRSAIKAKGLNVKDYSDRIDGLAEKFLNENPKGGEVVEQARIAVEAERAVATSAVDLGSLAA